MFEHQPLLETSRTRWQHGDWAALASTPLDMIEDHPDRAKIALLVGAAKAHLGAFDEAKTAIRRAAFWGCRRELIGRILTSTLHNSLGRVAACLDDDVGAAHHFKEAINLIEPRADAQLLARSRHVRETARMGLLPDAAKLLGMDLEAAEADPIKHAARLKLMRSEFDLIRNESAHSLVEHASSDNTAPHHPIFSMFARQRRKSSGIHVYDFLGGATRAAYNRRWGAFAPEKDKDVTQNLPPRNEHYLDWIAVLSAVINARGTFRMAELGAGWAPWLVRGALAARQRSDIKDCELLAVEADPTHYNWAREHFADNGLDPDRHAILHAAAAGSAGVLRFPVVKEPDVHYGASLADAAEMEETIEVQAYTLETLLDRFSGPLDFLQIEIQGAEYDLLHPAMDLLSRSVRAIMMGTHDGDALHDGLAAQFAKNGWKERLNLGASRTHPTRWGEITTDDGFLWFENLKMF